MHDVQGIGDAMNDNAGSGAGRTLFIASKSLSDATTNPHCIVVCKAPVNEEAMCFFAKCSSWSERALEPEPR